MTSDKSERERVIDGLREFADFLEAYPTVRADEQRFMIYAQNREVLANYARLTTWEKDYGNGDTGYFTLRKRFGSGAVLEVFTDRSHVCRRVVTGRRIVPARPAVEEHEEDVVTWECDGSLLGDALENA